MLTKVTRIVVSIVATFSLCNFTVTEAQPTTTSGAVSRTAGRDESSQIEHVRFFLAGTLIPKATPAGVAGGPARTASEAVPFALTPILIAQCTRAASGKLAFELLTNFGGVEDRSFYPPWRPADSNDLFQPPLQRLNFTMEFLGYTPVKPVKRQWEALLRPSGQYRYSPPSSASANMEDSTFYLRYLLALPTLRLTLADKAAEFGTASWLDQIRKEPLCKASLL